MGLSGITTPQIASQETPVKRATASDTRRVSFKYPVHNELAMNQQKNKLAELKILFEEKSIICVQLIVIECEEYLNYFYFNDKNESNKNVWT